MMRTFIGNLLTASAGIEIKLLQSHWSLDTGSLWEASYTEIVNDMRGVTWTKATSEEDFVCKIGNYLSSALPIYIEQEMRKEEKIQLQATKYLAG